MAVAFAMGIGSSEAAERGPIVRSAALLQDAALLYSVFRELHPGLYRYNSPEELDRHFAELTTALSHDQATLDAFTAFSRFTATVRCGHSYPNFYNQPRAIADLLEAGQNRLPFEFVWIDRRMVVTRNLSDEPRLAPGTVVDTVDGMRASRLLEDVLPLVRADGHNDAKRIDMLGVHGADRFESFDVYLSLVHPELGPDFSLKTSAGQFSVHGLSFDQRVAARPSNRPTTETNPLGWRLEFVEPRTAILTMPTWAAYNAKWDWKPYVRDAFRALVERGVTHLVIDLRGNEGGNSVGDEIAAHLIAADTSGDPSDRLTRYRQVPNQLRPVLDTWDQSFFDWGDEAVGPDARGFYRLNRVDERGDANVLHPQEPRFGGRVDVLVDAANSSATFEFASLVQSRGLGRLVGTATGGNLRGINGGAFFFLRLPNTGIEIDVPLIGRFPRVAMPDRGLEPDVVAAPTVSDIASGIDVGLRAALREGTGPD